MKILAMKPGHDGNVALVEDGVLRWQLEAEKDSFPRYEQITPDLFMRAGRYMETVPDVFALSGWVKGWHSVEPVVNGGYYGWGDGHKSCETIRFMGQEATLFSSTHERSHLFCSYGLSPFPQGQPCYALVWEGNLGCFYRIGANLEIERLGWPLVDPGNKYGQLFGIADPDFPSIKGHFRFSNAGKLMALAAFAKFTPLDHDGTQLIEQILASDGLVRKIEKAQFAWSRYHNIGVTHPDFQELAGHFSNRVFDIFYEFARANLTEGLPLLISGGCGLNCEWNSRWARSGLFDAVFVPPCTNDTGAAIGTAVEAQHHLTGNAKLHDWSVFCGEAFLDDDPVNPAQFSAGPVDLDEIAARLEAGEIIAWAEGRYEMGPRALGNRSILAEPFSEATRQRLNAIKKREDYRPVAAICLLDGAERWFDGELPGPHMLYFYRVKDDRLKAVTHVDGSCRVQTVTAAQNPQIAALLRAFERRTGSAVLCNTSLNFSERGFINRRSELASFCWEQGLDGFVANGIHYARRAHA
ncbi:carbamoyltransferase C-terminal domain-containing protein [Arhodomonas sp. AD133]|uniref:carbamoyltransferase C-terminal domain-containing protein n=1 Tax=Arhodomonas sp. AD133 TaxID=3415009 RepID=UPI003EB945C2